MKKGKIHMRLASAIIIIKMQAFHEWTVHKSKRKHSKPADIPASAPLPP